MTDSYHDDTDLLLLLLSMYRYVDPSVLVGFLVMIIVVVMDVMIFLIMIVHHVYQRHLIAGNAECLNRHTSFATTCTACLASCVLQEAVDALQAQLQQAETDCSVAQSRLEHREAQEADLAAAQEDLSSAQEVIR